MAGQRGVRIDRQGGRRTLRIDGTFASTYVPGEVATGSVWDAIACGLLVLPPARRRDILLLGLGGGSAARIARAIAPDARIVGVELRQDVVEAARAHLDLDALELDVRIGDARERVRDFRGEFDAVLEDVFIGQGRGAHKPEGFPFPALADAKRALRPGGVLVTNTLDEAAPMRVAMKSLFPEVLEVALHDFDNRVYVGSRVGPGARGLRRAVAADPYLAGSLPQLRVRASR